MRWNSGGPVAGAADVLRRPVGRGQVAHDAALDLVVQLPPQAEGEGPLGEDEDGSDEDLEQVVDEGGLAVLEGGVAEHLGDPRAGEDRGEEDPRLAAEGDARLPG